MRQLLFFCLLIFSGCFDASQSKLEVGGVRKEMLKKGLENKRRNSRWKIIYITLEQE